MAKELSPLVFNLGCVVIYLRVCVCVCAIECDQICTRMDKFMCPLRFSFLSANKAEHKPFILLPLSLTRLLSFM